MKVKEITAYLDLIAPPSFQESYDNAGLIVGNPEQEIQAALLTLDTTEEVVEEAINKNAGLIISHHPIVFGGLKTITGKNYVERTVLKAIKNDIAIFACHTNIDSTINGVNKKICDKLGLINCKILSPKTNELKKLVTFVPVADARKVRTAIFNAGAGHIGQYDQCSFNAEGLGSFRAGDQANPYIGKKGELHFEKELRIETIFPKYLTSVIINALFNAHPYEEVAYDIYPLDNKFAIAGSGMIGFTPEKTDEKVFLEKIKKIFHVKCIRHTKLFNKPIKKVAFCGGSGAFLIHKAIAAKADIFITGDIKYHQFFDAENKIILADIGHYESEQFTVELFYDLLIKNFPNFALHFTQINTNPINCFLV